MPGWFDQQGMQIDPLAWQRGGTPLSADTGFLPAGATSGGLLPVGGASVGAPSAGFQPAGGSGGGGPRGDANWIQFTNELAGYGGPGGAFDASQGRTGASQAAGAARGNLQPLVDQYNQRYGTQARVVNGDKIDFGQGAQDVVRDAGNGQSGFWLQEGGGGAPSGGGGGSYAGGGGGGGQPQFSNQGFGGFGGGGGQRFDGGGGWAPGGGPGMPTAPTVTNLQAPDAFNHPGLGSLGRFQGPGDVPGMERLSYNAMQAPDSQQAQQVGTPQQLSYNQLQAPQQFQGNRQADPGALTSQGLATPGAFQAERYQGLSPEEFAADPGRKFREQQALGAQANTIAHSGALRTGNALQAQGQLASDLASQEYSAADARARQTNAQNNQTSLGAYNTNAQTGLAYNQNANQNALQFGQQNIANRFNANEANYGRGAQEAQQGFENQFNVNNANNSNALGFGQANISNQQNAAQLNNQANLAFGGQNFQQGFTTNQANNQGQNAAAQQNNANALAAQGQQFGQSLGGFQANLGAQQQGFQQALGTHAQNAQTGLAYGAQNQQNALANYQAQTNAALGLGNLNLGYTQAANQFALGNRNVDLGYTQAGNQFALGQGNLDLTRQFGTYDRNYQSQVTDPWNQQFQLASLGRPAATR